MVVDFPMDAVAGARRTPERLKTGGVPPKPPATIFISLWPSVFWDFGSLFRTLRRHFLTRCCGSRIFVHVVAATSAWCRGTSFSPMWAARKTCPLGVAALAAPFPLFCRHHDGRRRRARPFRFSAPFALLREQRGIDWRIYLVLLLRLQMWISKDTRSFFRFGENVT